MSYYFGSQEPSFTDIYHHGILGQKWGIRRFQNEDGTLTKAGKDRYYEGKSETEKRLSNINNRISNSKQEIESLSNEYNKLDDEIYNSIKPYFDNENTQIKYSAIAGAAYCIGTNSTNMESLSRYIPWYAYDDGDQGSVTGMSIYLDEKGENVRKEINRKYYDMSKIERQLDTIDQGIMNNLIQSRKSWINDECISFTEKDRKDIQSAKSMIANIDLDKNLWYLSIAVDNLGLNSIDYKDMTESDWKNLNSEIKKLTA